MRFRPGDLVSKKIFSAGDDDLLLTGVATETEPQRCADFGHSSCVKLSNPLSQPALGDRHEVVQVYGAVRFHAIVRGERNLGGYAANRGGARRHRNGG